MRDACYLLPANTMSCVASYSLDVDLKDVDLITGVTVLFNGKVRGGGKTKVFTQSEAPFKGSLNFLVRAKGDRLIGTLSFTSTDNAIFKDEGITYGFINPGSQKIRIREDNPTKQLSIELSKDAPLPVASLMTSNQQDQEMINQLVLVDPLA